MKMNKTRPQMVYKNLCLAGVFLTAFLSMNCFALKPDWPEQTQVITVQDKPLKEFLSDLFAISSVTVVFSEQVQGRVSGRFEQSTDKTFDNIVKAYGLLPYYDGNVMHISTMAEVQSKSIHTAPELIDQILQQIIELNLTDSRQSIQIVKRSGLIKARGSAQFVNDVEELVTTMTESQQQIQNDVLLTGLSPNQHGSNPVSDMVFQTFQLRYASAVDVSYIQNNKEIVIPGVATLLSQMVNGGRHLTAPAPPINLRPNHTLPGLKGQGLNPQYDNQDNSESDVQLTSYLQPESGASQLYSGFSTNVHATPSGQVNTLRIIPERNLNAVIIRDYAQSMPLYADLIKQLDKEPQLIEIQVTIIDVDRNKLLDLGLDWRYQGSRTTARLGGGDNLDADGSAGGLLLNTVLGDAGQFIANIRALAQAGSAQVVSKPQVLTLSNLEAVLRNDESFFIRVAGNEEVDLFNVSAGTTLRVVPQVVGDKNYPQIRLSVSIEDGSIVPDASVDDIPVIENSSLNTQAIIYNGENLLLGGLVRETTRKNASKVPLLGDIPAVGNLFKRTVTTDTRTERLFLISPRIVSHQRRQQASYPTTDSERELLSSISPEYNHSSFYNDNDEYVRSKNKIFKNTVQKNKADKPSIKTDHYANNK